MALAYLLDCGYNKSGLSPWRGACSVSKTVLLARLLWSFRCWIHVVCLCRCPQICVDVLAERVLQWHHMVDNALEA